jgi:precorrin-8X/cobalt-precorrin-8 methylmutase
MKIELEAVKPEDIEKRSFEIIRSELKILPDSELEPVILRAIHTTADFEYAESLYFSPGAISAALNALKNGARIITDTNMAMAGINKAALEKLKCEAQCFMSDDDVAAEARANGTTRAVASMNKAMLLDGPLIFAIGNAPTALIRLYELIHEGRVCPALVIGAPVGFVNVVQSKELIMQTNVPCIVARGRKGGSNVTAAIVNALMYMLTR